jgi:hypothetical protein
MPGFRRGAVASAIERASDDQISLREVQTLNIVLENRRQFQKAETGWSCINSPKPRVFGRHRRLFDDHAVDARIAHLLKGECRVGASAEVATSAQDERGDDAGEIVAAASDALKISSAGTWKRKDARGLVEHGAIIHL